MSIISKIQSAFKDDEGYINESAVDIEDEYEQEGESISSQPQQEARQRTYAQPVQHTASLEMKVIKPDNQFDVVTVIGEHLLARRTVVLNLEDTNKEVSRRIIDFLSGVVFAINGKIKRSSSYTYLITPMNVDVSGEQPEQQDIPANKVLF